MPPRSSTRRATAKEKGKAVDASTSRSEPIRSPIVRPPSEPTSPDSSPYEEPMDVSEEGEQESPEEQPQNELLSRQIAFIASEPIRERGIRLDDSPISQRFLLTIEALGWGTFAKPPKKFSFEIVGEFYSSLQFLEDGLMKLFDQDFYFSDRAIRRAFRLSHVPEEEDLYFQLEHETLQWPTRAEIIYTLTLGREPEWSQKSTFRFKCGSLCGEARVWWLFIRGKLLGNKCSFELTTWIQNLLFCIVTRQPVDTIRTALRTGNLYGSSIAYPCLITAMCHEQHIQATDDVASGRPMKVLTIADSGLTTDKVKSCYDFHRRHYGGRGTVGWVEPFELTFDGAPSGNVEPEPRPCRRRCTESSEQTIQQDSYADQLHSLTEEFHGFRLVSRSDMYAIQHRVDTIDERTRRMEEEQARFYAE